MSMVQQLLIQMPKDNDKEKERSLYPRVNKGVNRINIRQIKTDEHTWTPIGSAIRCSGRCALLG